MVLPRGSPRCARRSGLYLPTRRTAIRFRSRVTARPLGNGQTKGRQRRPRVLMERRMPPQKARSEAEGHGLRYHHFSMFQAIPNDPGSNSRMPFGTTSSVFGENPKS